MAALVAEPASGDRLPEDLLDEAAAAIRRAAQGLRDDRQRRLALGGTPWDRPVRDVTGVQVREARLRLRLSQRELAQELGFSRGIVADAELGRRSCPPLLGAWAKRILNGGGGR